VYADGCESIDLIAAVKQQQDRGRILAGPTNEARLINSNGNTNSEVICCRRVFAELSEGVATPAGTNSPRPFPFLFASSIRSALQDLLKLGGV
jgi:hypothetical protein